jgi:hypothetical protein
MANLPEGAKPVNAVSGVFLKLGKKGDFLTGKILSRGEREDKYNPGKMQLLYTLLVEACESHKREQDESGNWVPSKDKQEVKVGDNAILTVSGDLKRKLSQVADGKRVHVVYGGITMATNAKTGAKVKQGVWEVYELPDLEAKKDGDVPF